jgi:glycosyltransferase involved in cell wall biosynthesis
MPQVSIFVQAYNTRRFLGECLESVLAQPCPGDLEIIVIDDASTDGTEAVARSFRDPRIRFIRHEQNRGAIATANEGYALAQGAFVARLDSDDRYRPEFLARTVPVLQADPRLGLVYGDIAMIDPEGRVTVPRGNVRRGGRPARGNEWLALLEDNFIPAPTTLMRREALRPWLPIPPQLRFLDWYLTVGVTEEWESCYLDEVLADYRIHGENMHRAMIRDRSGEATVFRVLDMVFSRPARRAEKTAARHRIYAANYLVQGDKYFGYGMNADARRCYLRAIRHRPALLGDVALLRHLVATGFRRRHYEAAKHFLRPLSGGKPPGPPKEERAA